MKVSGRAMVAVISTTAVVAAFGLAASPASAHQVGPPSTVYVGPAPASATLTASSAGRTWHPRGSSCDRPDYTSIQAAIEGVATGGTVVVCRGTYPGMVNVDRRITLAGRPGATIDATGDVYGVGVSASWSTITGLKVTERQPARTPTPASSPTASSPSPSGPPARWPPTTCASCTTRSPATSGSGIDINSSSYSTASFNNAHDNGVGINVADDIGLPANHNTITAQPDRRELRRLRHRPGRSHRRRGQRQPHRLQQLGRQRPGHRHRAGRVRRAAASSWPARCPAASSAQQPHHR